MEFTTSKIENPEYRSQQKLASVQDRNPEIGILPRELESIQMALEELICCAFRRQAAFRANLDALSSESFRFIPPASAKGSSAASSSSFLDEDSCSLPEPPLPVHTNHPSQSRGRVGAGKCSPVKEEPPMTSPVEALTGARSEIPLMYWKFVDEFCRPITREDIYSALAPICNSYKETDHFFDKPSLGSDVAPGSDLQIKAESDSLEEQNMSPSINSSPSSPKRRKLQRWRSSESPEPPPPPPESNETDDGLGICEIGPVTERLVSSLIQDSILTNSSYFPNPKPDDVSDDYEIDLSICGLKGRGAIRLENNLRNELRQLGFLDSDPETRLCTSCSDEVLCELRARQQELSRVMEVNKARLCNLHQVALHAAHNAQLQQRADLLDEEIMNNLQRVLSAKRNKKPLTKREHDTINKTLSDWKCIYQKLGVIGGSD